MTRRRLSAGAAFLVGLVATFYAARAVAFRIEGFDPDEATGSADCDQCTLTATLDSLPWIAVGIGIYLCLVAGAWWLLSRRRRAARLSRS